MKKIFFGIPLLLIVSCAQSQKNLTILDVQHYQFTIELNDADDSIKGNSLIDLRILKDTDWISLDLTARNPKGKGMEVVDVKENDRSLHFTRISDKLNIQFAKRINAGEVKKISIQYKGIPADGLIIATNKYGHRTFFADNWPNRAHNWLVCSDHPSDKASVDFIVIAPDHYQVISNGIKTEESNMANHFKLTHYQETVPLPTKVMVIGVADFAVNLAGMVKNIPIYSWVYPEEKENGFYDYALAKEILPFFIMHIGPYAYLKLANVQSKTIFGGMENASAIFYNENSVKGDRKVEALLAHEIAHQWFGNSATETDWQHIWLSEGFATYMTHLYLEAKYGSDTLVKRMKNDRDEVIAFSKIKKTPVVDTSITSNFLELLNVNSYQKGGWVLHMLRRKLGDSTFWKGIRKYYDDFAGRNANTEDFRNCMEQVSGQDLKSFFKQWLYSFGQPQLRIDWKYQTPEKELAIKIEQNQEGLFEFPLKILAITGSQKFSKSIFIKEKQTIVKMQVSEKPIRLVLDPDIDLLFTADLKELN
jgi:aminopeptidase N